MTAQEAITELLTDKLCLMAVASHPSLVNVEEIDIAISALEKQLPKKVCLIKPIYGIEDKTGFCPTCERQVVSWDFYCTRCGQALDWSDIE
jgi:hypothetical protein